MYFLGAMATDGNVSGNRPKLDQADEAWLMAIRDRLWPEATVRRVVDEIWVLESEEGEVIESSADCGYLEDLKTVSVPGSQVRRQRQALHTLQRHEARLTAWLAEYGVVPNKSLTLDFPRNLPADRIRDYVRGVVDGDGSIWIHNYSQAKGKDTVYEYQYPCVAVYSGSRQFIEGLKEAIEAQIEGGVTIAIVEKESGGTDLVPTGGIVQVLRISNWSAYKFLRWLYYAPDLLCLPRKRRIAHRIFAIYANPSKRDVDAVRQEIAEACEFRLLKMSYGLIAQVMGISRERVKNHCKDLPDIEATQYLLGRKTDPEIIAECCRLRKMEWSTYLISDEVGIHPATVYDNVYDIQVETRFTRAGDVVEQQAGIKRILELGRQGWTEAMIVEETGFSNAKVRKWLSKIPDRVRSQGLRKEVTPQIIARIEELYEQGRSRSEIAEVVNRSEATVKKRIRAFQLRREKQQGNH
jgi:AraC-like DNA-binding protein